VIGLLNATGELKQTVRYGPYGDNAEAAGTLPYNATNDPFLFQGGYHMPGGNKGSGNVPNELYHFGARYYDPTTGRWTQRDPMVSSEAYGFAGGDPVNESDPSGLLRWHFHWWGFSVAFSRHDMSNLMSALGVVSVVAAVGSAGTISLATGITAVATDVLVRLDRCWTIWIRWTGPSSVGVYKCYG
jgi:RHS repeat-associated protein